MLSAEGASIETPQATSGWGLGAPMGVGSGRGLCPSPEFF